MKKWKKFYAVMFMSLFLLAVGIFIYTNDLNDTSVAEGSVINDLQKEDEIPLIENRKENTLDNEEKDEKKPQTAKEKAKANNESKSSKEMVSTHKNSPVEDEIIIDGIKYVLTMDENIYSNLIGTITAVRNRGAKLYGVPNSDVFVILKDQQQIGYMSTGVTTVSPSHAVMVKDMLADSYEGITENIDLVIKTGATVQVDWEQPFKGYHIELKDGWLIINHF